MSTLATAGSLTPLLGVDGQIFDDAYPILENYLSVSFSSAEDDIFTGNFEEYYSSNNAFSVYCYDADGVVDALGSGFLGESGSISSIDFDGDDGGYFTIKGSLSWNSFNGITGGTINSIEVGYGSDWLLERGNIRINSNGEMTGTITQIIVHTGSYTLEYLGNISVVDGSGTLSKIHIYDDSGNSITVTGSYSAAAYSAAVESVDTVDEVLDVPSLFTGNDIFIVPDGSRDWHGFDGNDKITGGSLSDSLWGDNGADSLIGLGGNDSLVGGAGADVMTGGLGDDFYSVDNPLDKIVELVGQGDDHVVSTVSYVLPQNVEDLLLVGSGALNGTGNALDNVIEGNDADNTLNGGAGTDFLMGLAGNDTYVIDTLNDHVLENGGNDKIIVAFSNATATPVNFDLNNANFPGVENATITGTGLFNMTGTSANNILTGNTSFNSITGGDGNDVIDGGLGADVMDGGNGDDTFIVDSLFDVILDSSGTDTVFVKLTSGTFFLASGLENLALLGTSSTGATGNSGANTITGNSGANILNGVGGADSMAGGAGSDTYFVNEAGDTVTETIGGSTGGVDIVKSIVDFTLGANLEKLQLFGSDNLLGTGNSLANVITGNTGDNTLDGGDGKDSLVGGTGNDTYVVDLIVSSGVAKLQDVVTEASLGGTDTLKLRTSGDLGLLTPTTLVLASTLENLDASLTGLNKLNLTGNAASNVLTGNDWDNTISGGLGADTMNGGDGNDTFIVDNIGDVVSGGNGIDTIRSSLARDLTGSPDVENLVLTGSLAIGGTGNGLDNTLTGNTAANALNGGDGADHLFGLAGADILAGGLGNDILEGGLGADTLNGGDGSDTFVIHKVEASSVSNADVIGGFTAGAGGDALDIHDILTGYLSGSVDNWVRLSEVGGNTIVSVDANGITSGAAFIQIATLTGITGLDADQMVTDANLIVV